MILEAAANGIPAIANQVGGIPEALGDSGVLIPIESSDTVDRMHCRPLCQGDQEAHG